MTNRDIENYLTEEYKKLPAKVQDAIRAVDLRKRFDQLRDKHNLHIDQVGELENETMYTMFGLREAEEYESNVTKALGLPPEQVRTILNDVNELIFIPIQKAMQEASEEEAPEPSKLNVVTEHHEEGPIDRTKLLAEIEEPEKLLPAPAVTKAPIRPIPVVPVTPPQETAVPQPAPIVLTATGDTVTPPPAPKNIIEQKLSAPTHVPTRDVNVTQTPMRRSVDPYREMPE